MVRVAILLDNINRRMKEQAQRGGVMAEMGEAKLEDGRVVKVVQVNDLETLGMLLRAGKGLRKAVLVGERIIVGENVATQ
jgi:hypothetical protein